MMMVNELLKFLKEKIAVVCFFFIFFVLVYYLSKELGLANALKTSGGLIFLPAGARLFACLVGRAWGAFGVCLGSFFVVVPNTFPNETTAFHLAIAVISTTSVYLSVVISLGFLKVSYDLTNLKFIHLPFVDLVATFSQAFFFYLFLYLMNHVDEADLLPKFLAQMTGNFLGGMIFMFGLILVLNLTKKSDESK